MTVPNNPFPALSRPVDPTVLRSIRQASQATSMDFGLLMAQAEHESGFRADAKSATSSAAGLFQFVDSTWLDMVHRFGEKYGLGDLAQQISQNSSGKFVVAGTSIRQKILDLRQNPAISASLAAEYAKQNQTEMEQSLGRSLSRGDLYMAHFLGAGGATQFLKALDHKGDTPAATLLPDAAAANPAIFYDSSGHPKSVREIYQSVAAKIEKDAGTFGTEMASTLTASMPAASFAAASMAPMLGLNSNTGNAGNDTGIAASGHGIEWSGVKLSPPMLQMLDVVARAALKMVEDGGDAQPGTRTSLRPPTPRIEHSV